MGRVIELRCECECFAFCVCLHVSSTDSAVSETTRAETVNVDCIRSLFERATELFAKISLGRHINLWAYQLVGRHVNLLADIST